MADFWPIAFRGKYFVLKLTCDKRRRRAAPKALGAKHRRREAPKMNCELVSVYDWGLV